MKNSDYRIALLQVFDEHLRDLSEIAAVIGPENLDERFIPPTFDEWVTGLLVKAEHNQIAMKGIGGICTSQTF